MATLAELWQCNKATIYAPLLFAKIIKVRFVRITIKNKKNKKILYGFSCRRLFNKNNVAPDTHTPRQSETKLLTLCCKARFARERERPLPQLCSLSLSQSSRSLRRLRSQQSLQNFLNSVTSTTFRETDAFLLGNCSTQMRAWYWLQLNDTTIY